MEIERWIKLLKTFQSQLKSQEIVIKYKVVVKK